MQDDAKAKRSKPKVAAVVIVLLALAAGVVAAVFGGYTPFYRAFLQAPEQPYFAKQLEGIKDIEYVARIHDGLYRGADPSDGLEHLKQIGIKTIVNLRYMDMHDYRGKAEAMGFDYVRIPLFPDDPPTRQEIEKFIAIITDPERRPVYFHCAQGIDRTGVMAGIYRVELDGWDNTKAVAEMEFFGHNELWIDIEEFLKTYGKRGKSE